MLVESLNEVELFYIELFRVALSEPSLPGRTTAIANLRHNIIADRLEALENTEPPDWHVHPKNQELVHWIAATSSARHRAGEDFAKTVEQYERNLERRLNIAEEIGRHVWLSIVDREFAGLHKPAGILERVRHVGKKSGISGARDNDTLRKIWMTYRGVVHLGMAIDYCDDTSIEQPNVLHAAEELRLLLSRNCPRGTFKPYVDQSAQISFLYQSSTSGPRFLNRGLPFGLK